MGNNLKSDEFSVIWFVKTLPEMEKEVKIFEQRYNACTSLEKLAKKIEHLRKEMAWALVYEREKVSTN